MSSRDAVERARVAFNCGRTRDINFRRDQLKKLYRLVDENGPLLVEALGNDLKKPSFEAKMIETCYILNDIRGVLHNLDKYTAPEKVSTSLVTAFDDAFILNEPYGVVLIIGTWNYPLMVCLIPMIGAIAAGNTIVLKPSEIAPYSAKLMAELIPRYLDKSCYHVITGGAEITEELLNMKFDYIFFTGSQPVGKKVHQAAAKHLTPVTLELGGKSPTYIDETVGDEKYAFRRLLWAKMVNAGQTCVAPDYILCSAEVAKKFLRYASEILSQFYGPDQVNWTDIACIVNEKHFARLISILKRCDNIALGGKIDHEKRYIGPTILTNVKADDEIMREEIFGPILPIVIVESLDEAISFINRRPKPLTCYVFSKNRQVIQRILKETSSGSVCANDALVHLSIDSLPFGGVGDSGFGVYHGKSTFETFSHQKSVLIRGYSPILEWVSSKRYPPYSESNLKRLLRLLKKRQFVDIDPSWQGFLIFLLGAWTLYMAQHIFRDYMN